MYLSDLALTDFRSYIQTLIHIDPGVVILIGDNGQGKTNAVEAITYLATLSSHRVSSDAALIRQGAKLPSSKRKFCMGRRRRLFRSRSASVGPIVRASTADRCVRQRSSESSRRSSSLPKISN